MRQMSDAITDAGGDSLDELILASQAQLYSDSQQGARPRSRSGLGTVELSVIGKLKTR